MRLLISVLLLLGGCASVQQPNVSTLSYTNVIGVSMGEGRGGLHAVLPIPYKELKAGLWVRRAVWDRDGKIVSYIGHRLVHRDGPLWVTQGDNRLTNPEPDAIRLSPSNYAGVIADAETLKPL